MTNNHFKSINYTSITEACKKIMLKHITNAHRKDREDEFRGLDMTAAAGALDAWVEITNHTREEGDLKEMLGLLEIVYETDDGQQFVKEPQRLLMERAALITAATLLTNKCHEASKTAGWWKQGDTDNPLIFSNKLCLIHSEISEAMEGDRKNLKDDKLPHRDMREVELADAVIRIFDLAGAYGMDLGSAIVEKMEFNAQRADHKLENRALAGGKSY